MAGHNLQITIKSANQIDAITVSDKGVDILMPGSPQETVTAAKLLIQGALLALIASKAASIKDDFVDENVTIST